MIEDDFTRPRTHDLELVDEEDDDELDEEELDELVLLCDFILAVRRGFG